MEFIERKNIDLEKWNRRIQVSDIESVFCYSWYLDAVAENWGGLVSDVDYSTILPVPYSTKLGIKKFYQAPFTREYAIFGNDFSWEDAFGFLCKKLKHFHFRNQESGLLPGELERCHQYILLETRMVEKFHTNAKRLIKKGKEHFTFSLIDEPKFLIQLFKDTVAHKIDSIGEGDLKALLRLMEASKGTGQGEMIGVFNQANDLVAGGFFLKDKSRITYLKGASADEAKKLGAMFSLFDFAFNYYMNDYNYFDFGGSDVENVATFYKKFGAEDRKYYDYQMDLTPFWFRTLKKIKG
jgi:hypothetical protein